jgi:hypothetical protein
MIVSAGLENRFEGAQTTLQQIQTRSRIVQKETNKEHSNGVFFVFLYHDEVVSMVEIGLARTIVMERSAA